MTKEELQKKVQELEESNELLKDRMNDLLEEMENTKDKLIQSYELLLVAHGVV